MSRLTMTANHHLGKEEAGRRLKDKLRVLQEKYGYRASELDQRWSDGTLTFRFKAAGVRVHGTMVIGDHEVLLSADVPLAVALFHERIERRIRAELGSLLS